MAGTAQVEYLVTVDPTTGLHSIVGGIAGVQWVQTMPGASTFDETQGRYLFKGSAGNGGMRLHSVEATSGAIISDPVFDELPDPNDNIVELQLDNSTGLLYGLHWDASEQTEYLVQIDPATGMHMNVTAIAGVKWISLIPNCTTFDELNGRYIFRGIDADMAGRLYSVDVATGQVVSSPVFPVIDDPEDMITELKCDNSTGLIHGLFWDASLTSEHLVRIDPATGQHTLLGVIPLLRTVVTYPNYTAYDHQQGRYTFLGTNVFMEERLYTMDVNTGDVLSDPLFPVLEDPEDNVIELHFDNATGTLYGLHWDADSEVGIATDPGAGQVQVHPNPCHDRFTVSLGRMEEQVRADLLDAQGRLVRSIEERNVARFEMPLNGLPAGSYHLRLSTDRGNVLRSVVVR